jgi:TetR/AcrR family transcriptional regulator, transcriptional repressor for nem operon
MARQKEFERDVALAGAIRTFATFGFEGTSTELLTKGMGIGRQSLYDTFGDKRRLYKEALQRYCFDSVASLAASLQAAGSAIGAIEATLLSFAARVASRDEGGCLGVAAICEFGQRDREITTIGEASSSTLQGIFEAAVRRAKELDEAAKDIDPKEAALFLSSTLSGLKIAARAGAKREALASIARMAVRCLR